MASEASDLRADIPKELSGRFIVGDKMVERPSCYVYRGVDKELGDRPVALKIFVDKALGRQEWIDAFDKEIAILRAASHPSLVPIIAGGCDHGWFYIAMELLEGKTLRDYLKENTGPINPDTAIEIVSQLCAGLKEIHEKNGYHGHIDSRAVLFKGEEVRLAGYYPHVMSEMQKTMTSTGRLIVDPAYVSPDQISGGGQIDGRADIYAVSVLLYEMLTGQKPYVADSPMQLAMMRLSKDPEPPRKLNPNVPALVDAAVIKGLARDRNHRFSTVADFVDAMTGGKKPVKNPLLAAIGGEEGDRLTGTETIAVSMSTDSIKQILQGHEVKHRSARPTAAEATITHGKAVKDELSGVATSTGLKVDNSLKASFMVTSGDDKGKRFMLERPQVMIGSDAGCDIVLEGKNIPPRYAIVIQRNGEFFVGPLSGAPVTVNNAQIPSTSEAKLKRGDILNVGSVKLRFIAPGEAFTMQDSVADRVIDRPPSKMPKVLATLAIALLMICAGVFYMYRQSVDAGNRKRQLAAEQYKKKQSELIDTLRVQGDEFLKNGALIEPPEANARKRFEQILEVDSENTYAKRRLSEIDDRVKAINDQEGRRRQFADRIAKLLADGQRMFTAGNYIAPVGANARETYQEVLRLDSENETAKKQIVELNRILNDLIGQIKGMVDQAHVYMDEGAYVAPPGANAKELADKISAIDPSNPEGRNLVLEMAARSLMDGDRARAELKPEDMRRAYLNAQALGIDPDYIAKKLQGIDTITRSKSGVVIIDTSKDVKGEKAAGSKYLNMSDIEQRINLLNAQGYGQKGTDKKLYEINKGKIK